MKEKMKELAVVWLDGGIGAVIAGTALVSTVAEQYNKVIVCAVHPDVLINNHKIYELYSADDSSILFNKYLDMKDIPIFRNQYMHYRPSIKGEHICSLQHKFNGLKWDGRLPELFPELPTLNRFRDAFNPNGKNAVIHINGSTGTFNHGEKWNFNKEVKAEHWNEVVQVLKENEINIIQIGLESEVPINGTVNLLGKTSIADMIAIVEASDYVISIESCVQHMAGAFNKKGAVFYGPTSPKAFGYDSLLAIEPTSTCRYCGRPDTHYGDMTRMNGQIKPWTCRSKECIESISIDSVRNTLEKVVGIEPPKKDKK